MNSLSADWSVFCINSCNFSKIHSLEALLNEAINILLMNIKKYENPADLPNINISLN
jgi:hypothetical protein